MTAEKKRVEKERDEAREETKREVGALQARLVGTEKETEVLRAILTEATKKAAEAEDTEMSGTNSTNPTSHEITMKDTATNTERRTYAQAAAQTQAEKREEKETRKGKEKEVRGSVRAPARHPPGVNKAPIFHSGSRLWRT